CEPSAGWRPGPISGQPRRPAERPPLWTLLEVIFDTNYRRHLLGAGDLTAVAELMLPELECQINIWRMGLAEQHLAEIELKLRPGKDFGIGVVAEAVLALRPA